MLTIPKHDPYRNMLPDLGTGVRVGLAGCFAEGSIKGSRELRVQHKFLERNIKPLCGKDYSTAYVILDVIIMSQLVEADQNEKLNQLLEYKPYADIEYAGKSSVKDMTIEDIILGLPGEVKKGQLTIDTHLFLLSRGINQFLEEQGLILK